MARRVGILLLAMAGLALAEAEAPKMVDAHARLVFDGRYRAGWVPVVIEDLRNLTSQDADVEVRIESDPKTPLVSAWFSVPRQELGSKKRGFLYVYNPGSLPSLKLSVQRRGDEKPSVTRDITANYYYNQGIVVVSSNKLAAPIVGDAVYPQRTSGSYYNYNAPLTMPCEVDDMPDRWIGWSQADLVVIADVAWDKVDDRAWKALVEWVKSGGTVLISPKVEEAWFRDPHLKELCDLGRVTIDEAHRLPGKFSPGVPVPFARIPSEEGDLVVHRRVEFGNVYVLPFDLTGGPFLGWKGLSKMWAEATKGMSLGNENDLMNRGTEQGTDRYYSYAEQTGLDQAIRTEVRYGLRKLPEVMPLSICIILYILLVGPVNFLVLKRIRRPIWTIVTIPIVSALFVASVIGIGYWTKGSRTAVQRVAIVRLLSGHDFAVESRFTCLRAATPGEFGLKLDASEAPRVESPTESSYELAETGEIGIEKFPLHMWEEGYLRSDSVRQLGGTIEVTREGDLPVVANKTGMKIRAAIWIDFSSVALSGSRGAPGVYAKFGVIEPGKTVKAEGPLGVAESASRGAVAREALGLKGLDEGIMRYLLDVRYAAGKEAPTFFALVEGDDVPFTLTGRKAQEAGTLTVLVVHER